MDSIKTCDKTKTYENEKNKKQFKGPNNWYTAYYKLGYNSKSNY